MGAIYVTSCDDLPYGPGQSDYEYDLWRQDQVDEEMNKITFDEEKHEYRLDGRVIPSVTQIIKPVQRELGGSEETLDWKRQIGKALDHAVHIHACGKDIDPESLDDAVAPFFAAWLKFEEESGFRVLLDQPLVYSRKLRFGGHPDSIGGRGTAADELIDRKCVWSMDPATAIQTAGYAIAAEESLGIKIKARGGVQLLRDGTYRFHPYSNPNDEHVFRACVVVNAWKALHHK